MKRVLIPLAVIGFSLGAVTSASADCWQDRIGERSGFNFTDPQCSGYMSAEVGKPAFGTPSSEEKAPPSSAMPACDDMKDPKCAKPDESKGGMEEQKSMPERRTPY